MTRVHEAHPGQRERLPSQAGEQLLIGVSADSAAGESLDLAAARRTLAVPGRPLPWPAGRFATIRCCGIEAFSLTERAALLRSCRRLLATEGVLEIRAEEDPGDWLEDVGHTPGLARSTGFLPTVERPLEGELDTVSSAGERIFKLRKPVRVQESDPLVSVLIPAYKAEFFDECLRSALAQSHRNLEVVICDDSEGAHIEAIASARATGDPRIRYYKNERNIGARANHLRCHELARGSFIKWLDDDDTLEPECVERMLGCLQAHPEVTVVSAHRQCIDSEGRIGKDDDHTRRPFTESVLVEGSQAIDRFLATGLNFIGEPTCALYRRGDLGGTPPTVMSFAGRVPGISGDMAMWMTLLGKGDLLYLVDTLSNRRIHKAQSVMGGENASRLEEEMGRWREEAVLLGLRIDPEGECESVRPLDVLPWWSSRGNAHHRDGCRAFSEGRWAEAHAAWQRAATSAPGAALPLALQGEASLMLREWVRACGEFMAAIQIDSQCVRATMGMSTAMLCLERRDEAQECLRLTSELAVPAATGPGFYAPEPHGSWMGREGHLRIDRLLPMQGVRFELCTSPAVDYGALPLQIEVLSGTERIGELSFEQCEQCQQVLLSFPEPRAHVDVRLRSASAHHPFPVGDKPDRRALSVYIRQLSWLPLITDC